MNAIDDLINKQDQQIEELRTQLEAALADGERLRESLQAEESAQNYNQKYCHLPEAQEEIATAFHDAEMLRKAALSTSPSDWLREHDIALLESVNDHEGYAVQVKINELKESGE